MRTIYTHGHIVTMDKSQPYAESLCVEDGKIIAVGSYEDVKDFYTDDTHVIDLKNKTMLPGFIDAHSHFAGAANAMNQCDLSECHSFDDISNCLKDFIEKRHIPEGEWVHGCQYDHNFLKEQRHPDIFCLDKASTKHPIIITHSSNHMGSTNSLGLKLLGIDENTPDESDGKYGRIEGTQKPNGYMEENAFLGSQARLPTLSVERLLELMKDAQDMYASYGITTVQDGMVNQKLFDLLKHAAMNDLFKLDVVAYIDVIHEPTLFEENKEFDRKYFKHLKLGGYKVFLDGSPQGRTAWMMDPYEGEKDYRGYPIITDDELYQYVTKATDEHRQLLAHCNGDAACEQYVGVFEKVAKDQNKTELYRPVMVHAQLVQKQQLERMVPLHMMPSFFVAHTYFWGDIHLKNFGLARGSRISPVKDAVNLGLPYTFHQDTPVIPPNMIRTLYSAITRVTRTGVNIGEEQRVSAYQALEAITINAAYQYFEEDTKGSLTVGKVADMVILDKNPLEIDLEHFMDIQVLATIKNGQVIYKK